MGDIIQYLVRDDMVEVRLLLVGGERSSPRGVAPVVRLLAAQPGEGAPHAGAAAVSQASPATAGRESQA